MRLERSGGVFFASFHAVYHKPRRRCSFFFSFRLWSLSSGSLMEITNNFSMEKGIDFTQAHLFLPSLSEPLRRPKRKIEGDAIHREKNEYHLQCPDNLQFNTTLSKGLVTRKTKGKGKGVKCSTFEIFGG